jgi:hypothetical protein
VATVAVGSQLREVQYGLADSSSPNCHGMTDRVCQRSDDSSSAHGETSPAHGEWNRMIGELSSHVPVSGPFRIQYHRINAIYQVVGAVSAGGNVQLKLVQ